MVDPSNETRQAEPKITIGTARSTSAKYPEIVAFAQEVYLSRLNAKIEGQADLFGYVTLGEALVGCMGLTQATKQRSLRCQMFVPDLYERLSGGAETTNEEFAELGVRAVKLSREHLRLTVPMTTGVVASLLLQAGSMGVKYICFTSTHNSIKPVAESLGIPLLYLGERDDSRKDAPFKKNWARYANTKPQCFGFALTPHLHACKEKIDHLSQAGVEFFDSE